MSAKADVRSTWSIWVTKMRSGVELVRERKWDELAEKLLPRLVRAGFAGGVAGVVASLAAGAVQCAFFDD